jgi:hypothetical protein
MTNEEFYNNALKNPGNDRGGATLTGCTHTAAPRSGGHNEFGTDYASRIDRRSHKQWLLDGMPEPWDSENNTAGEERSKASVESFLRQLEPEDRSLLEVSMAFKGNVMQAAKFLQLPESTYRYRLDKACERAKVLLVEFYQWGSEPDCFTERLNEIRRQHGSQEFKVKNSAQVARAAYMRTGSMRAAARELNMSKSSLQRLLNAA